MTEHSEIPPKKIPIQAVIVESKAVDEAVSIAGDNSAKEYRQLSRKLPLDKIEEESKLNEHNRAQKFKNHFELISIIALYFIAGITAVFTLVWAIHTCGFWRWLNPEDVQTIQNITMGVFIIGLLSDHFRKRLR